jgi:hypothetical protein
MPEFMSLKPEQRVSGIVFTRDGELEYWQGESKANLITD